MRDLRGDHYWRPLLEMRRGHPAVSTHELNDTEILASYWHHLREARDALALAARVADRLPAMNVPVLVKCRNALHEMGGWITHDLNKPTDDAIGTALGSPMEIVEGVGMVRRHPRSKRTEWDRDELVQTVLDSRLIDAHTGEVADETPLDKVRHIWNLGAPRLTALRDRGLDPDDYCHYVREDGWDIEIRGAT